MERNASARSPWGLKTPGGAAVTGITKEQSVEMKAESSTRGLAVSDSLAPGVDDGGAGAMERAVIARRRRGRGQRGSVAAREVGKTLGRSRLLWLKNNWILVALVLFAVLGFIIMIGLLAQGCTKVDVQTVKQIRHEVAIFKRQDDIFVEKSCDNAVDTQGNSVVINVDCPGGQIEPVPDCKTVVPPIGSNCTNIVTSDPVGYAHG